MSALKSIFPETKNFFKNNKYTKTIFKNYKYKKSSLL